MDFLYLPPADSSDKLLILSSGVHGEAYYKEMGETVRAGKVWKGITTNKRKDGEFYVCEQTITPVFNKAGVITHAISMQQDVTDRIKDEENLLRKLSESNILQEVSIAGATLTNEDDIITTITQIIGDSFYSEKNRSSPLHQIQAFYYLKKSQEYLRYLF